MVHLSKSSKFCRIYRICGISRWGSQAHVFPIWRVQLIHRRPYLRRDAYRDIYWVDCDHPPPLTSSFTIISLWDCSPLGFWQILKCSILRPRCRFFPHVNDFPPTENDFPDTIASSRFFSFRLSLKWSRACVQRSEYKWFCDHVLHISFMPYHLHARQ